MRYPRAPRHRLVALPAVLAAVTVATVVTPSRATAATPTPAPNRRVDLQRDHVHPDLAGTRVLARAVERVL